MFKYTRRLLKIALVASISLIATHTRGAEPVSKEYLQDLYTNYLREEGYRPELDPASRVKFKYEGRFYYICPLEDDPEFFRLILPVGWKIDSEAEKNKALEVASSLIKQMKCVKIFQLNDEQIWISIELFFAQPNDFKPLFGRSLRALQRTYDSFVQKMSEKPAGSGSQSEGEKKNSGEARPSATFLPVPGRVPQPGRSFSV